MILRSVIKHFRNQEWTAIGIDFVIVVFGVFGVFVGIQVANWNDARAQQQLGLAYTERLKADLILDRSEKMKMISYYEVVHASAQRTIEMLSKAVLENPEELVIHAYRTTEYINFPQRRSTWEEMVSSGSLGLLPRMLSNKIYDYYVFDAAKDAKSALEMSSYRVHVRSEIPHIVQQAIRARCSDQLDQKKNDIVGFQFTCDIQLQDSEITKAADILTHDTKLLELLRYHFSILNVSLASLEGELFYIDRALESFQEEL